MPEDEKIARNCCWVEFDDGDSGEFPLQDVRLIPPDYPQEGTGKICYLAVIKPISGCVSHRLLQLDDKTSLLQVGDRLDASWSPRLSVHNLDANCFNKSATINLQHVQRVS